MHAMMIPFFCAIWYCFCYYFFFWHNVNETFSAFQRFPKAFLMCCLLFPDVVCSLYVMVSVSLPSTIYFFLLISLFYLILPSFSGFYKALLFLCEIAAA